MRYKIKLILNLILISTCITFHSSCKKSNSEFSISDYYVVYNNSSIVKPFSENDLASVIKDKEFISFMNILEEITTINENEKIKLTDSQLKNINSQLTNINSINAGLTVFKNYNIPNSMRLFELIAKLTPKAVNLFKSNAVFNNLNKNEISNLFLASIKEYKKNRLINNFKYSSFNADKCSRDYANGMASCDTNFTISTAASILAGAIIIFGTAGTGVVGGAVAVTGGIAGAYAALVVCRGDVVEAWEDCRNV